MRLRVSPCPSSGEDNVHSPLAVSHQHVFPVHHIHSENRDRDDEGVAKLRVNEVEHNTQFTVTALDHFQGHVTGALRSRE
ncbi:unnamed protein product [Echinostoma caproni]|uniref:Uncharacterized protein n=1 Tax=Echinostoma caproni TaxID=27848 RepID=A0A183AF92_9TREM|nr:unnamed protein product [Echinostoma caproni]